MNREEAIKKIKDFGLYHAIEDLPHSTKTVEAFKMAIQALEEPERKKGEWTVNKGLYQCSCCKHIWSELWWVESCPMERMYKIMPFCPNCGAVMRKETEDECESRRDCEGR